MNIIKLTEFRKDNTGKVTEAPVWVNFDHVTAFNKSSKGKDTHLQIKDKAYFFVKESPEEIMAMLFPDMIENPVDAIKPVRYIGAL
jgi:hypothetical protein